MVDEIAFEKVERCSAIVSLALAASIVIQVLSFGALAMSVHVVVAFLVLVSVLVCALIFVLVLVLMRAAP